MESANISPHQTVAGDFKTANRFCAPTQKRFRLLFKRDGLRQSADTFPEMRFRAFLGSGSPISSVGWYRRAANALGPSGILTLIASVSGRQDLDHNHHADERQSQAADQSQVNMHSGR
jgi:hypothetical protein